MFMPQHGVVPPEHSFQDQVQQSMDNTKGIQDPAKVSQEMEIHDGTLK
jgi:hypothetical protein